jgi:hypothetical protein
MIAKSFIDKSVINTPERREAIMEWLSFQREEDRAWMLKSEYGFKELEDTMMQLLPQPIAEEIIISLFFPKLPEKKRESIFSFEFLLRVFNSN